MRTSLQILKDKVSLGDSQILGERGLDELTEIAPVAYGFQAGPFTLLHDAYYSAEIIEDAQITSLPNTAPWFKGMIALRGHLIPVFDVYLLTGTAAPESTQRSVVVIGTNEEAAALYINALPARVHPDDLIPTDDITVPDVIRPAIIGAFSVKEHIWLDVDFPFFFELIGEQVNRRV